MSETIQEVLRERTADNRVGLKHGDRELSWIQHLREASAHAAALLGMADHSRRVHVGTLLGNSPVMLSQMAAAGLGGYVLCGINTTRRGDGLLADIRRSDCQLLVTDAITAAAGRLDLTEIRVVDTDTDEWAVSPAMTSRRSAARLPACTG